MTEDKSEQIEIRIEFERGTGDPSRVFRAMAGLIESTELLDNHLAQCIGANVRTSLILQDVETASLKAVLKTVIEDVPDEALKNGEIKKVIGHYLFKAKHKLLDWCNARDKINERDEIKLLEAELHKLAEQTDIKMLPAYALIETATLLSDINAVNDALDCLGKNDLATFKSPAGTSKYNPRLTVSPEVVKELITREIIASEGERILKVKKPDYLGNSKWCFKYREHMVEAKVFDEDWLRKFQSNHHTLNPGDSLRVILRESVGYGYNNDVVHTEYDVLEVKEVIRGVRGLQQSIL